MIDLASRRTCNDRFGQPEGLAVNLYVRRAPPDSPLSPWGGAQLGVILSFKLPRTAGNLILASGRCVCVVKSPLFSEWHRLREKVGFRAVRHAQQRQQGTAGKAKRTGGWCADAPCPPHPSARRKTLLFRIKYGTLIWNVGLNRQVPKNLPDRRTK